MKKYREAIIEVAAWIIVIIISVGIYKFLKLL